MAKMLAQECAKVAGNEKEVQSMFYVRTKERQLPWFIPKLQVDTEIPQQLPSSCLPSHEVERWRL
ncbi:hypothetical protein WQ56_16090 [Luteimonas sp. FCS-9]|nr:hypothetical protein WQ56_16090 [Luteimonas sp. FCS-9]